MSLIIFIFIDGLYVDVSVKAGELHKYMSMDYATAETVLPTYQDILSYYEPI